MNITDSMHGDATVVTVEGSVDTSTSEELMNTLMVLVEGGKLRLVLDFSGVDYISSAGLRALLGPLKEVKAKGGTMVLASVQENVKRVLQLSGFTSILEVHANVDAALARIGS